MALTSGRAAAPLGLPDGSPKQTGQADLLVHSSTVSTTDGFYSKIREVSELITHKSASFEQRLSEFSERLGRLEAKDAQAPMRVHVPGDTPALDGKDLGSSSPRAPGEEAGITEMMDEDVQFDSQAWKFVIRRLEHLEARLAAVGAQPEPLADAQLDPGLEITALPYVNADAMDASPKRRREDAATFSDGRLHEARTPSTGCKSGEASLESLDDRLERMFKRQRHWERSAWREQPLGAPQGLAAEGALGSLGLELQKLQAQVEEQASALRSVQEKSRQHEEGLEGEVTRRCLLISELHARIAREVAEVSLQVELHRESIECMVKQVQACRSEVTDLRRAFEVGRCSRLHELLQRERQERMQDIACLRDEAAEVRKELSSALSVAESTGVGLPTLLGRFPRDRKPPCTEDSELSANFLDQTPWCWVRDRSEVYVPWERPAPAQGEGVAPVPTLGPLADNPAKIPRPAWPAAT